jgi:archaellum component FlaF (FlaF/FlaG flagellin family)
MNSLSIKLTHDKFRFHVSTIEVNEDSLSIGGNNYKVQVKVKYSGQVDVEKVNNSVTENLLQICESIHHRTLIPGDSLMVTVFKTDCQVSIERNAGGSHFSFPISSVFICPLLNTKIEDLCKYIGVLLLDKVKEKSSLSESVSSLKLKLFQNIGPRSATMKFQVS